MPRLKRDQRPASLAQSSTPSRGKSPIVGFIVGLLTAGRCVAVVMHELEALRILEAKLTAIEEQYKAEFAENADLREALDAKAEAQALAAVFDFLKSCKIAPSHSLLRVFMRYLCPSRSHADAVGRELKS